MDRITQIREFVTKDQLGIELGPWFNPIVPRRLGYRSLILDVYDKTELRQRAEQDPAISNDDIPNIEDVDFLGSASNLAAFVDERGLSGQIDYIVSSHNFEHLPDPIRFLRECEKVLKPGGFLSMAIPDRRACFDYFRPHSTTGELLDAFWERRDRPTPGQLFTHVSLHAYKNVNNVDVSTWSIGADPATIRCVGNVANAFSSAETQIAGSGTYQDAHCWAFTPASFEWIVFDLQTTGLLKMQITKIAGPNGCEFYAHLVNTVPEVPSASSPELARRRTELLRRVHDEAGADASTSSRLRDGEYNREPEFDAAVYLKLHEDVAAAGVDPWAHYVAYGRREGRRLR